jgi:8-oxo-dGTP pyrophosphatase MutT (NUDIX family)
MHTDSAKHAEILSAATVILTRERAGALQVYLLKRSPRSGFMAGYFVFPGGMVDSCDLQLEIYGHHCDLTPEEIASRFGPQLSAEQALAYCAAAIRETFEEAGVPLFGWNRPPAVDPQHINRLRLTAGLEKGWLLKLVAEGSCRLALSSLSRWSHWITPVLMKRRFDTRFFMADMPSDHFCRPDDRETVRGIWLGLGESLAENMAGRIPLSPPTLVTIHELLEYKNAKVLQAERRKRSWGAARLPRLVPLAKAAVIVQPWDPMYHQETITIDMESLPARVLPVGEPFSRVWCDNGIWKPIGLEN